MKKSISALLIVISFLVVVILVNFFFNKPPSTLNEEYINSWVLMGNESIDKILFTNKGQDYTACICSVSADEIMFLVLENNETFDMHFRHSFTLNTLTDDPAQTMNDEMFSDEEIRYNIFLNPNVNTVTVDNVTLPVNIFQYHEYSLGFWWTEIN